MRLMRCFGWGLVLGVGLAAAAPASSARAAACGAGSGYTAYANAGTQYGGKIGEGGSGMKVFDPGADCAQVRSVLVWVDIYNYVEVGYFEDASGDLERCQTFSTPHLLVYAHQGSTTKCKQDPPALLAGGFYKVRVENPDHNNTYQYYLGTEYEGYYTVSFTQSYVRSFTERHGSDESLHANMDGLAFMGGSNNWNTWSGTTHASTGGVSGWTYCQDADPHYRVVASSC